jgi:hypothetical protein
MGCVAYQLTLPTFRRPIRAKYQNENATGNGIDCLQLACRNPGYASFKVKPKAENGEKEASR